MKKFALVAMFFLLIALVSCASTKLSNEVNENFRAEYDTNVKMRSKNDSNSTKKIEKEVKDTSEVEVAQQAKDVVGLKKSTGILLEVPRTIEEGQPLDFSPAPPEPGMRFIKDIFSTFDDNDKVEQKSAAEVVLEGTVESKLEPEITFQESIAPDLKPAKQTSEPVAEEQEVIVQEADEQQEILSKINLSSHSPRKVKGVIKYLFIPATGVEYNSELLADTILRYTSLFDIDLLVVSGEYRQLMTVVANLGVDFNMRWHASHIVSLCGQGVVFSKQNQKSVSGDPVVEFDNYTVLLYNLCSPTIDEKEMYIGKSESEGRKKFNSIISNFVSSEKPVLAFASPEEVTVADLQFNNVNIDGSGTLLTFDNQLNSYGFNDLFDSARFTAPTIGLQNPGYTYYSNKRKARIDFVYGRSVIPCSSSVMPLPVLSNKNGVRRYAITGSVAI